MSIKNDHVKRAAIDLRARKKSLDEISEMLNVPRTTVYYWIRGTSIGRTQKQSEARQAASLKNSAKARGKRDAVYNETFAAAEIILKDNRKRDFVILYLAEGYRKNKNSVAICNSNPAIVVFCQEVLVGMSSGNKIGYGLQFHVDQDEDYLKSFWSKVLQIDKDKIKLQRKSNSGQLSGRKWASKYGVLTVRTADTDLRMKLQALMDHVQKEWAPAIECPRPFIG
jgi:hypothetical protein